MKSQRSQAGGFHPAGGVKAVWNSSWFTQRNTMRITKTSSVRSDQKGRPPTAVKLNKSGFEHAQELIGHGKVVYDERDAWSEHQPPAEYENSFIQQYGWREFGKWHLGIDDEHAENTKARYKFPYGDFDRVHRCAVLSAESRAGQYKYYDIERAVAHLHGMIEAQKHSPGVRASTH